MHFNKNEGMGIGIILSILIIMLIITPTSLLNFSGNSACNNIFQLKCASQIGGIVTSISKISINSNFPLFSAPVYLINFVLNGAGQRLIGTYSPQSIAKAFNKKTNETQSISITSQINKQNLVFSYYNSGTTLYNTYLHSINNNYNYNFNKGYGGILTTCSQGYSNNIYSFACSNNHDGQIDDQLMINGFKNSCKSYNSNAKVYGIEISKSSFWSGTIQGLALSCYSISKNNLGNIYISSKAHINESISIIYKNGNIINKFKLTNANPQQTIANKIMAQIYGYTNTGINQFIGTGKAPLIIVKQSGQMNLIQPTSITSIENLNRLPTSCYTSANIQINSAPVYNVFNLNKLKACIIQQNIQINNLVARKIQVNSPFYNLKISNTNNNLKGVLNITNNPIFYPQIQLIVNAKSLNLYIPIAKPSIISYNPKPFKFVSGSISSLNLIVYNNASVSASAYLVITNKGQMIAETNDFNIPSHTQVIKSLTLSIYSNLKINKLVVLKATIYSSQDTKINQSIYINAIVEPSYSNGSLYQNNTNNHPEGNNTTIIKSNNTISGKCVNGYIYNSTIQSCVLIKSKTSPKTPSKIGMGWIILGIIIALIIYLVLRKKGIKGIKHINNISSQLQRYKINKNIGGLT